MKATVKTKRECGPSVLDVDWRRILTSHSFGSLSVDLRKSFPNFVKSICIKNMQISETGLASSLKTFTARRLIRLDKNPGLHPIGAGDIFRRIVRKVAIYIA